MNSGALVLYKQTPALVVSVSDKVEIKTPGGKTRSVRNKDIQLLHPGPAESFFPDLEKNAPEGQIEEAWELLQGESPSLKELAELVYGGFTPQSAWLAFKLLNRTPWFKGTVDSIEVSDPESVKERLKKEKEKEEAEAQWNSFIERFKAGRADTEKDEVFLRDLFMYALGKSKGSRILKALGKTQTPENAHRVLIQKNIVPLWWNPYPLRLDVPLDVPEWKLPETAEENIERLDLQDIEAYAIDDEGNKDPDDAVSWDGKYFWVHVADIAAAVPSGSEADQAAMERASSLYLPEKTVPMLPPEAAGNFGLGMRALSPALSYRFEIDENFNVTDFSIFLTTVKVTRMTYREAEEKLEAQPFKTIKKITDNFSRKRFENGAVSINMPEVRISVNDAHKVSINLLPPYKSRDMVAESMLMAGNYAAKWCSERDIPVLYSSQEISGDNLSETENDSAEKIRTDSSVMSAESLVESYNLRRGMQRSRTTMEPLPHKGLGLEMYVRVTSPLRRYTDLLVSRQIRNTLLGKDTDSAETVQKALGSYESRIGSLIQAERRSNYFWKLYWLLQNPEWKGDAILLERLERQGIFLIPQLAMESRIPLKKELDTGSKVQLKAKRVDIPDASVIFGIVEHKE